jgi:F0F1-type ATP synthase assembly protein I
MAEEPEKKPVSLETLNQHLDEVKKLQPQVNSEARLPGDAARAAIDFASASAVGTILGYGVDLWQHTSPWGILVGLLIGVAAGMKLMFQEFAREDAKNAGKTKND